MGRYDSSLTRVKPLFDFIASDVEKLNQFIKLFDFNNQVIQHNSLEGIHYGDNEKRMPPPKSLLIWMLQNLNQLNKVPNYGTKNPETYKRRELLFSGCTKSVTEAINLIETKSKHPKGAWYIFEGSTVPDIFIETTDSIFIGEAKRTEKNITTTTQWLSQRDQLIRHIDSLLDQPKKIYSFYILEKKEYLKGPYKESMKLYSKKDYFNLNLKHRDTSIIDRAFDSFMGFAFWEDIADHFNIIFSDEINE